MAAGHLLDTKTVNLNEILGNGKIYKVPPFQRDYSWEQDNWEDLWNDICIADDTGTAHYMGSVVLQSERGKEYLIIDGQQRFTTLSILILAVINAIKSLSRHGIDVDGNSERSELLIRQYIGQKDPSSLKHSSKLFLNENNDGFYQSRLMSFKDPINARKLSDSEQLMWQCYQFFVTRITQRFGNSSGVDLAKFLNETVGEQMMFIQITVEDELNAYTVFETLNSRGVELTSTDLLKNFLFSLVARSGTDLKLVRTQWNKIIDIIDLKEFPVFLRYFLIATRKIVSKEYLFKEIKKFIKSSEDVFELLEQLERYAYNYKALGSPEDELWNLDKDSRNAIRNLNTFRVTQWKPLAMVAKEKLESVEFRKVLQAIVVISYRYNVIAKAQTNEMEKVYSNAAIALYLNDNPKLSSVLNDLKEIYINDDEFRNYFELKRFNTVNSTDKRLARYTLYKLEAQETNGVTHDFETDNGTIEHILPESFPQEWQEGFSEEEFERCVFMLGNLTLLEAAKNSRDAANFSFERKKSVYATSKFALTNKIDNLEWKPQTIRHRQAHLAKIAVSVWKIQY